MPTIFGGIPVGTEYMPTLRRCGQYRRGRWADKAKIETGAVLSLVIMTGPD